jgi:uncharacterized protein YndB with AHSA1/START domain
MRPIRVGVTIDAPRERVFEYLSDVANHVEFCDHYLKDFRLDRIASRGVGAAGSFRIAFGRALWGEIAIAELDPPHLIVLDGHTGRLGRVGVHAEYRLTQHGREGTRVDYEVSTTPATRTDRLREAFGGRAWLRRQSGKAVRRLAQVLEQGRPASHAVRVAAG